MNASGTPNSCFGGNYGTGSYSDNNSFCQYVVARYAYLENECGNFGTATLTIDPSLGSIAQAEATRVAGGGCPTGTQACDGFDALVYVDPQSTSACYGKNAMYTAPESSIDLGVSSAWAAADGGPLNMQACWFAGETNEAPNIDFYHYCNWECAGKYGDPTTQPSKVGCGTAVDTQGVTWRVVKLGP